MLEPKKVKRRRQHRRRSSFSGKAYRGSTLAFGSIGLKAMSTGEITARQIEAARRAMTRSVQEEFDADYFFNVEEKYGYVFSQTHQ